MAKKNAVKGHHKKAPPAKCRRCGKEGCKAVTIAPFNKKKTGHRKPKTIKECQRKEFGF